MLKTLVITMATMMYGAFTASLYSQGSIVLNGVTQVNDMLPYLNVRVIQNPQNGDYTGFLLHPLSATSFMFDPVADEGVRTFIVSASDTMSLNSISSVAYTEMTAGNSYSFNTGSDFYLGLYTGATFRQNGVYADPLFGWGHFINNSGTIQLLDSALAYGGGGIIVGTQTILPIPEPATLSLVAIGATGLLLIRRKSAYRG